MDCLLSLGGREGPACGEAAPSLPFQGFRKVGYPGRLRVSMGGRGGVGVLEPDRNAFFSEAKEPFRGPRKPDDELLEVPGVTMELDEPFSYFPRRGRSGRSPSLALVLDRKDDGPVE